MFPWGFLIFQKNSMNTPQEKICLFLPHMWKFVYQMLSLAFLIKQKPKEKKCHQVKWKMQCDGDFNALIVKELCKKSPSIMRIEDNMMVNHKCVLQVLFQLEIISGFLVSPLVKQLIAQRRRFYITLCCSFFFFLKFHYSTRVRILVSRRHISLSRRLEA